MPDGTEALQGGESVQPIADTPVTPPEQAEGASEPQEGQEGWAPPSFLDQHLAGALGKLPTEEREAFLSLGPDGLELVRDHVLKSVDYHAKRQKESRELREMKERLTQAEQAAQMWENAKADPQTAIRLFQAALGDDGNTAQEQEPEISFRDILYETDPERAENLVRDYERSQRERLRREVLEEIRRERENSPEAKVGALSQRAAQIKQSSGLSQDQWNNALSRVQGVLDKKRIDWRTLDPDAFELLIDPVIAYEQERSGSGRGGLNPSTLSGPQAAGLRGSGPSGSAPMLKKPSANAPIEERLAWSLKTQGKNSFDELMR